MFARAMVCEARSCSTSTQRWGKSLQKRGGRRGGKRSGTSGRSVARAVLQSNSTRRLVALRGNKHPFFLDETVFDCPTRPFLLGKGILIEMTPEDLACYYGGDESKVPFEYLDPCCQREILAERAYRDVGKQLRRTDRSQQRIDATRKVFSQARSAADWQCSCCTMSEDYPSLRKMKAELVAASPPSTLLEEKEEDEDDSDLDLLDLMIPLTEEEQARLDHAAREEERLRWARDSFLRLGTHLDDSLPHLLTLTQALPDLPLLVHVYQDDRLNALVDCALERLAVRCLGTLFRRLSSASCVSTETTGSYPEIVEAFNRALLEDRSCLLALHGGQVRAVLRRDDLEGLGDSVPLFVTHLERWMEHAHVLEEELPQAVLNPKVLLAAGLQQEGEEKEEERFCDDPDCIKRYPHEHVGDRSRSNGGSSNRAAPSFLLSRQAGDEVFMSGFRQRI